MCNLYESFFFPASVLTSMVVLTVLVLTLRFVGVQYAPSFAVLSSAVCSHWPLFCVCLSQSMKVLEYSSHNVHTSTGLEKDSRISEMQAMFL